jgi:hypothetical protein
LIFNFAMDCKVHFSLKIQRKSIWKQHQWTVFQPRRQSALTRDIARAPRQLPYARRARTLRHRQTQWSMRRAGNVTVGDVRERLDGAKWLIPTRRRANRRTPLGRRTSSRLTTHAARALATWLTPWPPNRPPAPIKTRPGLSSRAHAPAAEPRRPPLAPPGVNLPPVDALTHASP